MVLHSASLQLITKDVKRTEITKMSELVKFFSLSIPLELCSDHFPSLLCRPEGINKDPTV
jgi:hypothetical protein